MRRAAYSLAGQPAERGYIIIIPRAVPTAADYSPVMGCVYCLQKARMPVTTAKKSRTFFDVREKYGTPCRNRTYNCPLGGGCYIHLTKEAYHKLYYSIFGARFQAPAVYFVCFAQKLCWDFVAEKFPDCRTHYFLAFAKVFVRSFCENNNCELIGLKALNPHEYKPRKGKKWSSRRTCLI